MNPLEASDYLDEVEITEIWRSAHIRDIKALVCMLRHLQERVYYLESRVNRMEGGRDDW